jgi:hypothetical protein
MTAQRKVGQRGYEKDEPRDIVLKLRLTQTEADILNEIAERANRPTTKIVMSALNSMFYLSALSNILVPLTEKSHPEVKERLDWLRTRLKEIKDDFAQKAQNGNKDSQLFLTAIIETEVTLLRYANKSLDWIDFEKERTSLELFDL